MSSTSVDNRIVQMTFDNDEFEKRMSQTSKSLSSFDDQINGMSKKGGGLLSNMFSKIAQTGAVGWSAINNVTNRLVDSGIDTLKKFTSLSAFSWNNISAGMEKYETQTIKAKGAMNQLNMTGEEAAEVMDALMWYSDATSYSLNNMNAAFATMSAQGLLPEESIPLIMGIGNAMSYAGLSAESSGYGFEVWAKAISKGFLGLREAQSLNNMGAMTANLRQQFIDAAVALGTLEKRGEEFYTITALTGKKSQEVSLANFDYTLADKWLNGDVIKAVMAIDYGEFATELYDFMQTEAGMFLTVDEAVEALQNEKGVFDMLGARALQAAEEARTFGEATNAVKDAVSSGWAYIFQKVLGNAEEATELFTTINGVLVDLFMKPLYKLEAIVDAWASSGGRAQLIDLIDSIAKAVQGIVKPVKEAWTEIFGEVDYAAIGQRIAQVTAKLNLFVMKLIPTEETSEKIRKIATKIIKVLKGLKDLLSALWQWIKPLAQTVLQKIGEGLSFILDKLGDLLPKITAWIQNNINIRDSLDKVGDTCSNVKDKINDLEPAIDGAKSKLSGWWDSIKTFLGNVGSFASDVWKQITGLFSGDNSLLDKIKNITSEDLKNSGKTILYIGAGLFLLIRAIAKFKKVKNIINIMNEFKNAILGNLQTKNLDTTSRAILRFAFAIGIVTAATLALAAVDIGKLAKGLGAFAIMTGIFVGAILAIQKITKSSTGRVGRSDSFLSKLGLNQRAFTDAMAMYKKMNAILQLAKALAVLAASVWLLSKVAEGGHLWEAVGAFATISVLAVGLAIAIDKLIKDPSKITKAMFSIAGGVALMAGAVWILTKALIPLIDAVSGNEEAFKTVMPYIISLIGIFAIVAVIGAAIGEGSVYALALGAAMVLMSAAVLVLAFAFQQLEKVDLAALAQNIASFAQEGVGAGAFAILGIATILGLAGVALSPLAATLGALAVTLGIAFLLFAGALKIIEGINPDTIVAFFDTLINAIDWGSLFELLGATTLLGIAGLELGAFALALIAVGGGIIAIAGGIAALSAALLVAQNIDGEKVGQLLRELGEPFNEKSGTGLGILAFAAACLELGLAGPAFLVFASSMLPASLMFKAIDAQNVVDKLKTLALGLTTKINGEKNPFWALEKLGLLGLTAGPGWILFGTSIAALVLGLKRFEKIDADTIVGNLKKIVIGLTSKTDGDKNMFWAFEKLGGLGDTAAPGISRFSNALSDFSDAAGKGTDGFKNLGPAVLYFIRILDEIDWALFDQFTDFVKKLAKESSDFIKIGDAFDKLGKGADLLAKAISSLAMNDFPMLIAQVNELMSYFNMLIEKLNLAAISAEGFVIKLGKENIEKVGNFIGKIDELSDSIDDLKEDFKTLGTDVYTVVDDLKSEVKNKFDKIYDDFKDFGKDIINGLKDGIDNNKYIATSAVQRLGNDLMNKFATTTGIQSPSKEFKKFGRFIDLGLAEGITANTNSPVDAAERMATNTLSAVKEAMEIVGDMASEELVDPVIRPVLDLSEIQNGSGRLNSMFGRSAVGVNLNNRIGTGIITNGMLSGQMSDIQNLMISTNGKDGVDASTIGEMICEALNHANVYMDKDKVGSLITNYQYNMRKAGGY